MVTTGEFGGDTTFGGHGAGGDPTAVAVVSDLLQAARGHWGEVGSPDHISAASCEISGDRELPHYLRLVVRDRPGIIASLAGVSPATISTSTPFYKSPATRDRPYLS